MVSRSERPTTPPLFDVAKYAKDSDARVASVASRGVAETPEIVGGELGARKSETRLLTQPSLRSSIPDEVWASTITGTPFVVTYGEALRRLPLDHRAGFILSLMDGTIELDTLVEVSAMTRPDALRLIRDLVESGIVEFR